MRDDNDVGVETGMGDDTDLLASDNDGVERCFLRENRGFRKDVGGAVSMGCSFCLSFALEAAVEDEASRENRSLTFFRFGSFDGADNATVDVITRCLGVDGALVVCVIALKALL